MSKPDAKRDLDALIKATGENRAALSKTQQKMERLEAAIHSLQISSLESERKRGKGKPN